MILFDFQCTGLSCEEHFKIKEVYVSNPDERPECDFCHKQMHKVLGYGLGTVKGGTPRFHGR